MISFIFGTYNRVNLLRTCLDSIYEAMRSVPAGPVGTNFEIIVADGGSTDGTHALLDRSNTRMVYGGREGAVRAFNAAYKEAVGDYIVTLNDDCILAPTAIVAAKALLDTDEKIGQVAFGYTRQTAQVIIEEICSGRPYANFGMIRTGVAMAAADICGGFWNPRYRTYGGDTELSCWVWRLGYRVEPIRKPLVQDLLHDDALRAANYGPPAVADGRLFWDRWGKDKSAPIHKITPHGEYPNIDPEELAKLKMYEAHE